jgi:hypothetical protein
LHTYQWLSQGDCHRSCCRTNTYPARHNSLTHLLQIQATDPGAPMRTSADCGSH